MADFIGKFNHRVDAKGRVAIPPKFGKLLSSNLVVTLSPSGNCLYVFEPEDFNEWVKSFFAKDGGFQQFNPTHVNIRSVLKGRAQRVEKDSAGRISLTAEQRKATKIESDAVFIGNDGYLEIWDPTAREEFDNSIDLTSLLCSFSA